MSKLLDHWHAAVLGRGLTDAPQKVTIDGIPIVLYRTSHGEVAALSDVCPHRRMSLSQGKVCGDRLQCPYHGWSFDAEGCGESPGTPKLRTRTQAYETRECAGLIWVRRAGASTEFPRFINRVESFRPMVQMVHDVSAPLELVLDNFNELEHTATTHASFGFPLDRMHEVEVEAVQREDHVVIRYHGPSKPYSWVNRFFLRIGKNIRWYIEGETHFSPVYTIGEYRWQTIETGKYSPVQVINAHLLTPLSREETRVFTLSYMRVEKGGFPWLLPIVRLFMRRQYINEVNEDQRMLNGLCDKSTELSGLKLSRFDRVLGLNRKCIAALYRRETSLEFDHVVSHH